MKIRDTLIISLAIIAAGYMVADSLKPAQAIGEGKYNIAATYWSKYSAPVALVVNTSTGAVQYCVPDPDKYYMDCSKWSDEVE